MLAFFFIKSNDAIVGMSDFVEVSLNHALYEKHNGFKSGLLKTKLTVIILYLNKI